MLQIVSLRNIIISIIVSLSVAGFAKKPSSLYQVDIIVFTHLTTHLMPQDNSTPLPLAPNLDHAILLQTNIGNQPIPYHIRPASVSGLRDEYWALNRKPQYQILFHYTWLQPSGNEKPIALLEQNNGGWNIEGTMSIRQNNYYLLDTELLFSAPNSKQTAFMFSQKQRLKPGVVYYLDHPQAGMLIKIHQIT